MTEEKYRKRKICGAMPEKHKDTGGDASRFNNGKPRYSLLPFTSMEEVVRVMEKGADKYGRDNWRSGLGFTSTADSALRHIFAWLDGEDNDPEFGTNHLAHATVNLLFLLTYIKTHPELDDRKRG